jgi:adenosine deaminase
MENNYSLHSHLGSSNDPRTLFEISRLNGIKLKKGLKNYNVFKKTLTETENQNHSSYLDKFHLTELIQSSPNAIEKCVYNAFCDDYVKNNIVVSEIRFNPMFRNLEGSYDLDVIISSACIGMQKAMTVYPIKCGLIICTDRRLTINQSEVLASKAIKFKNLGVVGFDCAGPYDKKINLEELKEIYKWVKSENLGTTIHIGETDQYDKINSLKELEYVIKEFSIDRIGHGILLPKLDKNYTHIVLDKNIHFEICPTSNLITKSCNNLSEMESILNHFNKNKISFSIETDGVLFLNTNIKKEYEIVKNMNINNLDIEKIKNNAYENSFIINKKI